MRDTLYVSTSIDLITLIERLTEQLTREELIKFIKRLDLEVADWDFTNELTDYFNHQQKIFQSEVLNKLSNN